MTSPFRQSESTREAIRQYEAKPYDPYTDSPWRDVTEEEFRSLTVGKVLEIAEYDDPFALLVFADGTAIQVYGMSAQSTDCLCLSRWSPDSA